MRTGALQYLDELPTCLRGMEGVQRYRERDSTVFARVLPGEFYVTIEDEWVKTTLGSCVAACIRDPEVGVGGMNHFLLPVERCRHEDGEGTPIGLSTRYGANAMEMLINTILSHGGRRERLELKVFGGGNVMQNLSDIGRQNIDFIEAYARNEGFRIVARDVGDELSRVVVYHPNSGRALVKCSRVGQQSALVHREREYLASIERQQVGGDVELF